MVLPIVTTATGAFLVVIVFGMSEGIRAQSASLGHADEIGRAVVLIAVTVLLVGVVEVAVTTTRTVAHRTRELGVLGANGVPRKPGHRGPARRTRRSPRCWELSSGAALAGADRSRARRHGGRWQRECRSSGLILGVAIALGVSIVAPRWPPASCPPGTRRRGRRSDP